MGLAAHQLNYAHLILLVLVKGDCAQPSQQHASIIACLHRMSTLRAKCGRNGRKAKSLKSCRLCLSDLCIQEADVDIGSKSCGMCL